MSTASKPRIEVFTTSILSSGAIRSRVERVTRHLARIEYTSFDVASDESAKKYWKLKNGGINELPCILVDGERVGSVEDLDEAVEFGELNQFLRLTSPPPQSTQLAPSSSSSPSTSTSALPSINSTYTVPSKPVPTTDDFSSLNLTAQELEELEAELNSTTTTGEEGERLSFDTYDLESKKGSGFISDRPEMVYKHEPIAPLNFSKNRTKIVDIGREEGGYEEPVVVKKALPELEGLKLRGRDELDGIELSEEETRQLLKDLGLDDEEIEEGDESVVTKGNEGNEEARPSTTSTRSESTQVETATGKESSLSKSTTIEGPGGASLSAPLNEVNRLDLSRIPLEEISVPMGTQLEIEPFSQSEIDLKEASPSEPLVFEGEGKEKEQEAEGGSSIEDVKHLKKVLNHDVGDTGNGSSSIPVVGEDMEEKLV